MSEVARARSCELVAADVAIVAGSIAAASRMSHSGCGSRVGVSLAWRRVLESVS